MLSMTNPYDGHLIIQDNTGLAFQEQIHGHQKGNVLARTPEHISVKWPGGNLYQSLGSISKYYSPNIMVFEILDTKHESSRGKPVEILSVRHILDWDAGRKKKEEHTQ